MRTCLLFAKTGCLCCPSPWEGGPVYQVVAIVKVIWEMGVEMFLHQEEIQVEFR